MSQLPFPPNYTRTASVWEISTPPERLLEFIRKCFAFKLIVRKNVDACAKLKINDFLVMNWLFKKQNTLIKNYLI